VLLLPRRHATPCYRCCCAELLASPHLTAFVATQDYSTKLGWGRADYDLFCRAEHRAPAWGESHRKPHLNGGFIGDEHRESVPSRAWMFAESF